VRDYHIGPFEVTVITAGR